MHACKRRVHVDCLQQLAPLLPLCCCCQRACGAAKHRTPAAAAHNMQARTRACTAITHTSRLAQHTVHTRAHKPGVLSAGLRLDAAQAMPPSSRRVVLLRLRLLPPTCCLLAATPPTAALRPSCALKGHAVRTDLWAGQDTGVCLSRWHKCEAAAAVHAAAHSAAIASHMQLRWLLPLPQGVDEARACRVVTPHGMNTCASATRRRRGRGAHTRATLTWHCSSAQSLAHSWLHSVRVTAFRAPNHAFCRADVPKHTCCTVRGEIGLPTSYPYWCMPSEALR
jgi:hypothetical protein